jgi:starch-binding outer membrane protein, SusD/RagB family
MKRVLQLFIFLWVLFAATSCHDILEPKPIDLLTDEVVLNEAKDVPNVEVGLYSSFRPVAPATIIAGDATADMLIHHGTFTQYQELDSKDITSANASVATLWANIYNTVYIANFILENLPGVPGVKTADRNRVMGAAHFLRGYCYFVALNSFGGIPEVTGIDIATNRNIPRGSAADILTLIQADYDFASTNLPAIPLNVAYAGQTTVKAAQARLNLYIQNWAKAESLATAVIQSNLYSLDSAFSDIVTKDFPPESIFEVGYTSVDDPGTDSNIGLNSLFVGRREIIPSNSTILALASTESGDRFSTISFNASDLKGNDNGWSVAKYGTIDQDNNNVTVFRLGEMYLIRAEARAQQGHVTGIGSAMEDINVLRKRAHAPTISAASQSQMLLLIENERLYELAYEGHRWYDLVRTGRAKDVMTAYSKNWQDRNNLWPIPQHELLNNPGLANDQNPGY